MSRATLDSALDQAELGTRELEQPVVDAVRRAMIALRAQDRTLADRIVLDHAVIDAKR